MILDLILIQCIIVFIIDLSGAVDSFKLFISNILTKGKIQTTNYDLKPFTCSLCMTHWLGLLYLILTSQFTFGSYGLVCLLAFLTPVTSSILLYCKDLIIYVINKLNTKLYV